MREDPADGKQGVKRNSVPTRVLDRQRSKQQVKDPLSLTDSPGYGTYLGFGTENPKKQQRERT